MRILLVEDDATLREMVAGYLRASGFAVDAVDTGKMALVQGAVSPVDAVVLDVGLPDMDGFAVCRALRDRARRDGMAPPRILMATARDAVADRIAGLDGGADDYLVKPYALGELVARLRALLRRPADALPPTLQVADLSLDTATRIARRGAREIPLTTKEFAVLEVLMRHPGEVVTRERISRHAWDDNFDPASNVIDVYVGRLRRKVDADGERPLVETVRGAGYRLGEPVDARRGDVR
jgi:DNA-binding response OmpR family regulator